MNKTIKYSLLSLCFLQSIFVFAQQDAMIRMYFIDPAFYNPSLESNADHALAVMNYRKQWLGMENAPSHQYFGISTPLMKKKLGLGFRMLNEQHGLTERMSFTTDFAYKLSLSDYQRLSFGVAMSLLNQRLDFTRANAEDMSDQYIYDNMLNMTAFDINLGLSYQYKTLSLGIAMPNIFSSPYRSFQESSPAPYALNRQFISTASYSFSIMNSKYYFKPHMLYRVGFGEKNDIQLGVISDWKHKVWLGMTYHLGNAFSTQLGYKVYDKVEIAYSYDYPLTDITSISKSSHEITLVYHFSKAHQPNPVPAGGANSLDQVYQKINAQQVQIMDLESDMKEQKEITAELRLDLDLAISKIKNLDKLRGDVDSVMSDPQGNLQSLIDDSTDDNNEDGSGTGSSGKDNKGGKGKQSNQQEGDKLKVQKVLNKNAGPSTTQGHYVIVTGLKSLVNSRPLINELRKKGHNPFVIKNPRTGWYYVILGVYEDNKQANAQYIQLKAHGYKDAWVHTYK
jgi:type IX secretion system PorP/SprF family membrane protein